MSDRAEDLERRMGEATLAIEAQGDEVRMLKDDLKTKKKAKADITGLDDKVLASIAALKARKDDLKVLEDEFEALTGIPKNKLAFREKVVKALESRMFYMPSFKIYGGVAGLYDYGPPGSALKANVTQFWRQHFVMQEGMLEVECPAVTPHCVLKASGHVDRFEDFMITDTVTGDPIRADHLLEAWLERMLEDKTTTADAAARATHDLATVGEMKLPDLQAKLDEYACTNPETGNPISKAYPFNLMFKTTIGPKGDNVGYLRPETAQGIFVNFRDLLYYNGGKLPFAAAQIGQSFRNEISPKEGLLRVREFTQAEIEHFCHPDNKSHPRFSEISAVAPLMYSAAQQVDPNQRATALPLGEAVQTGIVANETLAYFIGRTYLFMTSVGINPLRLRFRQHLPAEMAHYATDCWDCEIQSSYRWEECAGLADRSAFDLTAHTQASGVDLVAYEKFDEPRMEEVTEIVPNMGILGKQLKKAGKLVSEHLKALEPADALALKERLASGSAAEVTVEGEAYSITQDMVSIQQVTKKVSGRNFVPSVIEPSFGIGRVLYCLFEHTFYQRPATGDEVPRNVFRFSPLIAPTKTTVFPLLQRPDLNDLAHQISLQLRSSGLSNLIDTTGATIGRRYARTDEMGVPFAVTVDYATLGDQTVTVRERDSMSQVRVPIAELAEVLKSLCELRRTWDDVAANYPAQAPAAETE